MPGIRDEDGKKLAFMVREIRGRVQRRSGGWTPVRLWTSLLDAHHHPASRLLALYAQRWEVEITIKELKIEMRGSDIPSWPYVQKISMVFFERAIRRFTICYAGFHPQERISTMTPKENVIRTIRFQRPERPARDLPEPHGSDLVWISMQPNVDARRSGKDGQTVDEWGAVWGNIGVCNLGEVKDPPLKDWADFSKLRIPDVDAESRWASLPEQLAALDPSKFVMANGVSLYERIHFVRGLENTWMDIYQEPENLRKMIDLLMDMNLCAIRRYARVGANGYCWCDDWGLQNKLMIRPDKWREFWKPAYARVYQAAHEAGMLTFLHSCGCILDILEDLIEAGLDVIQLDQQLNMSLEALGRYRGKITFWCPVDIQAVMPRSDLDEIRTYCHTMFEKLATPHGGFISKWYGDPAGAGHSREAIDAMCREFLTLDYRTL
jgi:hypothetical protein